MEEIRKQQQRQDKIAGYLAIPVMLIVAAIFKLSGHANFGGAVFAGLLGSWRHCLRILSLGESRR